MKDSFIIIFDADNTLWDTNAIFQEAQFAILKDFQDAGWLTNFQSRLGELRRIDNLLMQRHRKNEYSFDDLVIALSLFYNQNLSEDIAVSLALERRGESLDSSTLAVVTKAKQKFFQKLEGIPNLLPGVQEVLNILYEHRLRNRNLATVLFSEGKAERLDPVMLTHNFKEKSYFDEIVIGQKSPESFKKAAQTVSFENEGNAPIVVVVGDSLKRDIQPANEAGFVTVYIPGGFQGNEKPKLINEEPNFTIRNIYQLLPILQKLGVSIN